MQGGEDLGGEPIQADGGIQIRQNIGSKHGASYWSAWSATRIGIKTGLNLGTEQVEGDGAGGHLKGGASSATRIVEVGKDGVGQHLAGDGTGRYALG